MANGHGLFEEVQKMFDDETVPQSVSNRLIMAAIINERKDRLIRDDEILAKVTHNCEDIERLKYNNKRWAGLNALLVAIGTVIASVIGTRAP